MQGYIVFKGCKRLATVKKLIERAHWEPAWGTVKENICYCKKQDNTPFIKGNEPADRKVTRIDPKKEIERDPIHGLQIVANKRTLIGIKLEREMLKEVALGILNKPTIYYVYGASGTGKTWWAINDAVVKYGTRNVTMLRFVNSFAICNNPQAEAIILPEFRPSCIDAATFLEFTDGYGMILNVKHSQVYIRPRAIYICSVKHPHEIYKEEINEQFMRRITIFIDKNKDPYMRTVETEEDGELVEWNSD